MSDTLEQVRVMVVAGDVVISAHGYDEMADDDIAIADVMSGVAAAAVVEDSRITRRGRVC